MLPFQCVLAPGFGERGWDRVALPRQWDLEGIRNRGSVPKRGLTQSQYAGWSNTPSCPTYKLLQHRNLALAPSANLDQNPRSLERTCLYLLFMHFPTNISFLQINVPLLIQLTLVVLKNYIVDRYSKFLIVSSTEIEDNQNRRYKN